MLDEQTRTKIRRLHYAEHWPIGTIARELNLHHDTVRRAPGERKATAVPVVRPSKLDPFKPFIGETLEQHPRLRATRLFEMLKPRGCDGSVIQVRRHVAKIRPASSREPFLRLSTLPGEPGQVDWGSLARSPSVTHAARCRAL